MPSGAQCVLSALVSQIHCVVSPLCLLLTGWTNGKFTLSREAVTVSVTCLFTSSNTSAKRLTINCCHCTLSVLLITCASLQPAHECAQLLRRPSLGLMTSTHCKRLTFLTVQYFSGSRRGHKWMESSLRRWVRCVVRGWPVGLQEVNGTISFCCESATKHTLPSLVKIACRSATIGKFSQSIPKMIFSVASVIRPTLYDVVTSS